LKALHFIPPAVALVLVGGWVGSQRHSISVVENETVVLRKRLAAVAAEIDDGGSARRAAAPGKTAGGRDVIDWKKVAAQMGGMNRGGSMSDMRAMVKLQQQLISMSRDELATALKELTALDLPADSQAILENMLIGPLVEKDPEFALTLFADRLNDDRNGTNWQLSRAMQEWLKKDSRAAGAWFDEQIAAGKFESKTLDGKNQTRLQFEGALITTLMESDPAAVSARLAALPVDQRSQVLSNHMTGNLKEENQAAFADLVRSQLAEADQARTFAQTASRMASDEGYEKVNSYMDRINATPAERAACVEQVANSKVQVLSRTQKVTRENIESIREWAQSQAPDASDSVTGKALARASSGGRSTMEFSEAAELAGQYHAASGNDDVLIGFLEGGSAWSHKEQARELAAKISDEKRRNQILQQLN
jgi:hypothetical protein